MIALPWPLDICPVLEISRYLAVLYRQLDLSSLFVVVCSHLAGPGSGWNMVLVPGAGVKFIVETSLVTVAHTIPTWPHLSSQHWQCLHSITCESYHWWALGPGANGRSLTTCKEQFPEPSVSVE